MLSELEQKFRERFSGLDTDTLNEAWANLTRNIFSSTNPRESAEKLGALLDHSGGVNKKVESIIEGYTTSEAAYRIRMRQELGEEQSMIDFTPFNPSTYQRGSGPWYQDMHKDYHESPFTDFQTFLRNQTT